MKDELTRISEQLAAMQKQQAESSMPKEAIESMLSELSAGIADIVAALETPRPPAPAPMAPEVHVHPQLEVAAAPAPAAPDVHVNVEPTPIEHHINIPPAPPPVIHLMPAEGDERGWVLTMIRDKAGVLESISVRRD